MLRISHSQSNGEETKAGVVDLYAMCLRVHYEGPMQSPSQPLYLSIRKEVRIHLPEWHPTDLQYLQDLNSTPNDVECSLSCLGLMQ